MIHQVHTVSVCGEGPFCLPAEFGIFLQEVFQLQYGGYVPGRIAAFEKAAAECLTLNLMVMGLARIPLFMRSVTVFVLAESV